MVGIRRLLGVTSPPSGRRERAPFGPALALTVALAFASFLIVMSVIWVVHPPHRLPGYLAAGGDQNQGTKTALYVLAFAVILPLALAAVPRLADAIAAGPNAPALPALAGLVAGTLAVAVLLVKLSALVPWGDGTGTLLVALGVWGAAATALLRRAAQARPWPALLSLAPSARAVTVLAGALVFGLILCVTALHTLSLLPIVLGVLVAAAVLAAGEQVRLPRVAGRLGIAADIVLGLLLMLAIPDLLVFDPGIHVPTLLNLNGVMQFHHDFLLGPANQVLRGGVLMVDEPVSQWGVGSIYLLAAWFHIAPIGYGTYALLDGILTALLYGAAYCVLRIAGVSRVLAGATLAIGVAAFVYNLHYPVGGLPQQGPLRFGLPMAAVLPAVVAARKPRHARAARVLVLIVLGVSSVWALEGFAYTLFAFAAMACTVAASGRRGNAALAVRQRVLAAAAFACAHLTFALATLAASGELPALGPVPGLRARVPARR